MEMTYKQFAKSCETELNNRFLEKDSSLGIKTITTTKNNGITKLGLTLSEPQNNTSPIIYLNDVFDHYEQGVEFESICNVLEAKFESALSHNLSISNLGLYDFAASKPLLVQQLINHKSNQHLLTGQPHRKIHDLALRYKLKFDTPKTSDSIATVTVTNSMLEQWGVTENDLFQASKDNVLENNTTVLHSLEHVINSLIDEEEPENLLEAPSIDAEGFFVLSNIDKTFGASLITNTELLKDISDKLGESFTVLPSSIHETLIVPDSVGLSKEDLASMVRDVNDTQVDPEELLSYNVYAFDHELGALEVIPSEPHRAQSMER